MLCLLYYVLARKHYVYQQESRTMESFSPWPGFVVLGLYKGMVEKNHWDLDRNLARLFFQNHLKVKLTEFVSLFLFRQSSVSVS